MAPYQRSPISPWFFPVMTQQYGPEQHHPLTKLLQVYNLIIYLNAADSVLVWTHRSWVSVRTARNVDFWKQRYLCALWLVTMCPCLTCHDFINPFLCYLLSVLCSGMHAEMYIMCTRQTLYKYRRIAYYYFYLFLILLLPLALLRSAILRGSQPMNFIIGNDVTSFSVYELELELSGRNQTEFACIVNAAWIINYMHCCWAIAYNASTVYCTCN